MWTPAANHIEPGPPDSAADLRPGSLAPVLRRLAEKLRLEREDVVEHAVDAPSLEPVVSDHARTLEVPAQRSAERPIDSRAASDLCLLQQLQAPIESELPCAMLGRVHTPRTSTLPSPGGWPDRQARRPGWARFLQGRRRPPQGRRPAPRAG